MQWVIGCCPHRKFRRVGPADDDGSRIQQILYDRGISWCDNIFKGSDAVGGRFSLDINVDLDGNGNAVQGAEFFASGEEETAAPGSTGLGS